MAATLAEIAQALISRPNAAANGSGVAPIASALIAAPKFNARDHPRDSSGKFSAAPSLHIAKSKDEQREVLRGSWAAHGRELDYDDLPDSIFGAEAKDWNARHGTSIDPENYRFGEHPEFERNFEDKHLTGRMAAFPGVGAANDYFEGRGEHQHGSWLSGKQPSGWNAVGKPDEDAEK